MDEVIAKLQEWMALYGLKVVGAIVILVVGRIVAAVMRGITRRAMTKAKTDPTLVSFVSRLVYIGVMVFALIAAIKNVGVETTSLVAVIGAAGLAIGLALQGSLANFAAGVLLIIFRPFRAGDFIDAAGVSGTVEEVRIFTTTLITPDNRLVVAPNAKLTGDNIVNYSALGTRRVDLVIGVDYGADLKQAKQLLMEVLTADERILEDPAPKVAVLELADSSVNLAVRPWTNAADYWDVYFDTLERAKAQLDEAGIGIPFPQTDVHLFQHETA